MKISIGVFFLLVVLLIASPFYVGKRIEDTARQQIEAYQVAGFRYTLDVDREYRRSVLTYGIAAEPEFLSAGYDMSLSDASDLSEVLGRVELKVHAQHGPILTENGFELGWADLSASWDRSVSPDLAKILESMNVDEFFTANSRVGLTGAGDFEFSARRWGYVDPTTNDNLRFNGMSGEGSFSRFGKEYSVSAQIQGAIVAAEFAYIAIGPIALAAQGEVEEGFKYWGDGEGTIGFDSIIFSSELANISVSDAQILASVKDGDAPALGNIEYVVKVDDFGSTDLDLKNFEAFFAYTNIDKQFFEDYLEMAAALDPNDQGVSGQEFLSFLEAELPTALAAGPGFSMPKLAFSHEGRDFDLGLELNIDGQKVPSDFTVAEQNFLSLVPALNGQLRLDADESLVNYFLQLYAENSVDASLASFNQNEVTPEMRQSFIDQQATVMLELATGQGFIINENGRLQSDISLVDSALDLNGTAIPLPF